MATRTGRHARVPRWLSFLLLGVGGGCGEGAEPPTEQADALGAQALETIRANPCDLSLSTRDPMTLTAGPPDSVLARVLAGTVDLVNEAHDCQRLVIGVEAAREFGPLVGLFPVDATLALARGDFATARRAITLYSWGAAGGSYMDEYPELGISGGAHCVWLRNATDTETGWRAAVVTGSVCGMGQAPGDSAFVYPVFARRYPRTSAGDYPRTARWEWDLGTGRQFVGVKCGDAWCAIMPAGSGTPRTRPLPEPLRGSDLPRLAIPGWSDAQHLAVVDRARGRVRPGPWGTVLSHPALHQDAPEWAQGILAAAIDVEDDGSPAYDLYAERFYLQPGGGGGRSDVILRFPGTSPDEAWYQQGPMRRRQASGVLYTPALDTPARGTVRWRWQDDASTLWLFCRAGSCHVEA